MKLQTFGIEVRKIGSTKHLFNDVDMVLRQNNIPPGGVSAQTQAMAVAHALQKMMKPDQWFSVCTIDDCIKASGVVVSSERYSIYKTCHCIHWNEMLPEYRQVIIAMVLDDFRALLNPES